MRKWIEILLHVSVVVLAVVVLRNPAAARKWMWDKLGYSTPPPAPSTVTSAPVKRHARVESQPAQAAPVESGIPAAAPVAIPDPETPEAILTQLSAEKTEWPQTVVCQGVVNFPTLVNGNVTGCLKVPAGMPLKVLDVQTNQITVGYLTTRQVVPANQTNLVAQVLAKRHAAQEVH
jgi:hypothetical protein